MEFDFEVIGPIPHNAVLFVNPREPWDDDTRVTFMEALARWAKESHPSWCHAEHERAAEVRPIVLFGIDDMALLDEDHMREMGWVRA